ncbi:thiamine pyrophosphate-dependent dehydrogenase E1 component subunit alpha [Chondromyces crocatus]|uniref:2-oxoisovalerate dehydrogenase subunit alpha n=1 Tax=Chondromyces crocatus TaxID=52 RepID=A0A0K1EP57_CHOCO|nr:thiamine pyrophosphate-dependent enzyme [Chondromyces crocatus]AKT42442.1 2-oxoisovalerate dehydrogenase subunit alpha [Chondromyces crocatus]
MSTATHTEHNKPSAGGSAPAPTNSGQGLRPEDLNSDGVLKVLRDDGSLDPATDPGLGSDEVIALYKAMVRTRMLDERLVTLQRQGRIGFHIGSLGEEACILGSTAAMRDKDWIFPCYREFSAMLWRGMPLQRYIDNMFGNANDLVKGRQMPDHYTYREGRFGSVSSPIGTQIVQAAGFAWAAKMKKEDLAVLVYFGDGATSSSDFHNGMNFAGVFKAPVVFLCRNNGWAISVPTERQTASATFAEKGVAYGIPGVRVDGNDLFAVIKATRDATARAARGEGPTIIEALTYRMSGHSTSDDPKAYRPDNTLDPWKQLDPIQRVRRHLVLAHGWKDEQDKQIETETDAELRACVAVAEKTPAPSLESMFEDVFAELPWHLKEQRDELLKGPRAKGHGGH